MTRDSGSLIGPPCSDPVASSTNRAATPARSAGLGAVLYRSTSSPENPSNDPPSRYRIARTPIAGTKKKAVLIVPTILPAVDNAYSTPALAPTVARSRATSLIANGEVIPISTLGTVNSVTDASSGFSRGPRVQESKATSTGRETTGRGRT